MARWLRRPSRCRRHCQLSVLSLSLFFISMYLVMWQQRTKCLRKTAFISLWHNELREARHSRWRPPKLHWDWQREMYPERFLLCNRHVVEIQVCSLPSPNRHRAQSWLKAGVRAGNRPSHMFIQPWPPHGPAIVLLSGTEWACRGVRASRMTSPAGGMRGQTGCFYFCLAWYSWSFIPLR